MLIRDNTTYMKDVVRPYGAWPRHLPPISYFWAVLLQLWCVFDVNHWHLHVLLGGLTLGFWRHFGIRDGEPEHMGVCVPWSPQGLAHGWELWERQVLITPEIRTKLPSTGLGLKWHWLLVLSLVCKVLNQKVAALSKNLWGHGHRAFEQEETWWEMKRERAEGQAMQS